MLQEISLNGEWKLRGEPQGYGHTKALKLTHKQDGWIYTPVPGDIHQEIIAAGKIKEPLLGLNNLDCEYTEKRSWWYRKSFEIQLEWLEAELIELGLNGREPNAKIFLNGEPLGSHRNTFHLLS